MNNKTFWVESKVTPRREIARMNIKIEISTPQALEKLRFRVLFDSKLSGLFCVF